MKAAVFHAFGPPDVLEYEDVPDPIAGPGEVVVRVHAVTINRTLDCLVRQGHHSQERRGVKLPHVLGVDPAGVIVAVGPGGEAPVIGTRVACLSHCPGGGMLGIKCWGGYAELVKVSTNQVVPISDKLNFAEGATVLRHGPMTHYLLFDLGNLQPGETVLVMGAAGGLGTTGIQVAKAAGAKVICTAGSDERVRVGLDFGADHGINYNKENFSEKTLNISSRYSSYVCLYPICFRPVQFDKSRHGRKMCLTPLRAKIYA